MDLSEAELEDRRGSWSPPEAEVSGWLARYADHVRGAEEGAVLRPEG